MRRPRSIYILGTRYALEFRKDLEKTDEAHGLQNWKERKIILDASLEGEALGETFIHEICHCVSDAQNLETAKNEEDLVRRCTTAVIEISRNKKNKKAFDWWAALYIEK